MFFFFFFQAEDGIRDRTVTGVQTCALPIFGESGTYDRRDPPDTGHRNGAPAANPPHGPPRPERFGKDRAGLERCHPGDSQYLGRSGPRQMEADSDSGTESATALDRGRSIASAAGRGKP